VTNTTKFCPKRYWLAPYVRVCLTPQCAVILDMRVGQYFALGLHESTRLELFVTGWTDSTLRDAKDLEPAAEEASLLMELENAGIICPIEQPTSAYRSPPIPHPRSQLIHGYLGNSVKPRYRDIARCLLAIGISRFLLRACSLKTIATKIRARPTTLPTSVNAEDLKHYVGIFQRVFKITTQASDACLLNTIALGEFLAKNHIYPNYIFGVTTNPFSAHCWLQLGNVVLNDTSENVSQYTPILVI
jgi:Transglutaminase-like superfamily